MSVQSCGPTAAVTGVLQARESSQQALAAMRKEREALLAELSRLQVDEERVIARLDKLEEALAAAEKALASNKMDQTAEEIESSASSANEAQAQPQAPAHTHRTHAAEHAAGGMSAAIKRSIGRAVQSFAQESSRHQKPEGGQNHQLNHSASEEEKSQIAAKAGAHDGVAAAHLQAAGVGQSHRTKTDRVDQRAAEIGRGKSVKETEKGKEAGKKAGKEKAAQSDNPFAGLQAALNAFDQTF